MRSDYCYVIDDDNAERERFINVASEVGFSKSNIISFSYGKELLKHLTTRPADESIVILSDVMMEPMDGLVLCAEIRKRHLTNVEVIFMTRNDDVIQRCEEFFPLGVYRKDDLDSSAFNEALSHAFQAKVLLLDDDSNYLIGLKKKFESIGMNVFLESDPQRLLGSAEKISHFDYFILDVDLGSSKPHGIDVYTHITAAIKKPRVSRVCIVSGLPKESIVSRLGCDVAANVSSTIQNALIKTTLPSLGFCVHVMTKDELAENFDTLGGSDK